MKLKENIYTFSNKEGHCNSIEGMVTLNNKDKVIITTKKVMVKWKYNFGV